MDEQKLAEEAGLAYRKAWFHRTSSFVFGKWYSLSLSVPWPASRKRWVSGEDEFEVVHEHASAGLARLVKWGFPLQKVPV
jgi:hypothetical protein